jgi:hypothetical protein
VLSQEWRVLLELLEQYEDTVAEIAKYAAVTDSSSSSSSSSAGWQQLAAQLKAEDLRATIRKARSAGSCGAADGAGAAIATAERDALLSGMPGAAVLTEVADASAASDAGGWLRSLKFDPEQHRCVSCAIGLSYICIEAALIGASVNTHSSLLVWFSRELSMPGSDQAAADSATVCNCCRCCCVSSLQPAV